MLYANWTSHGVNIYLPRATSTGGKKDIWCKLTFTADRYTKIVITNKGGGVTRRVGDLTWYSASR